MIQDLCIEVADTRDESVANATRVTLASSETSVEICNVLWGSERRLTGFRDAVFGASVCSSSDHRRVICFSRSSSLAGIICRLLNASWVACGRNDRWDTSASNVIGNEASNRRDRRGWDGEELAGINIIDEAEEDAFAAGMGTALGHAEGCGFCRGSY